MNFKDMLSKISQLSEATKDTGKGKIHTAEPGGYGRKDDEDEEGKKVKADAPKKGRGRPKKDADETGDTKTYDTKGLSNVFGGGQKPKKEIGKVSAKNKLKEYIELMDRALKEAEQIQIKPASQVPQKPGQPAVPGQKPAVPGQPQVQGQQPQNTQVIQQGNKTLGTVNNPQLAQQIKQSIGKGEMTLMPDEQMAEDSEDYSPKAARAGHDIGKPGKNFSKIAASAGKKYGSSEAGKRVAGAILAKLRSKTNEADLPPNDSMASPLSLEEGIDHRMKAAHHAGKAHALSKQGYNCSYDDLEEARMYHQGYKEGLDECYGQMDTMENVGQEVDDMASFGAHTPEIADEGNAFTAALAKTPKGGHFSLGGKTMTDRSGYDNAFESWDNQLNDLLTEGMSVSISKGQQGSPDSVTITAQDAEADQLLSFVKNAGLGIFGGDEPNGYGAPQGAATDVGGIDVVDDHDGMMALMKKLTGQGSEGSEDYADEEGSEEHGHEHEEACETCGMQECDCGSEHQMVDEVETEDQLEYEVAEDNAPDSGAEETEEEVQDTAQANQSAAEYDEGEDELEEDGEEVNVEESYANSDDDQFMADEDFMMNTITGGLNKKKRDVAGNGQSTVPVTAVRTNESINEWMKLAGIK